MELRHLRYFVAVAEELSFTRAAERLHMNQPPLSLQIHQLEKELGAQLFRRHGRGVELTDAGKLLLEESRVILKQIEHARDGVARKVRGTTGTIRIGAGSGIFLHPMITRIFGAVHKQFPEVTLVPEEDAGPMIVARVRADAIDLALSRERIADDSKLAIEPLVAEEVLAVLPVGHRLSALKSISPAALARETFIMFPQAWYPALFDAAMAEFRQAGFEPAFGQEVSHAAGAIALVAAGFGISIVTRCMAMATNSSGVAFVPLEMPLVRPQIWLVARKREDARSVLNFISIARQERQTWDAELQRADGTWPGGAQRLLARTL
jgi:DNA-binding transcriptional LysR family regulator